MSIIGEVWGNPGLSKHGNICLPSSCQAPGLGDLWQPPVEVEQLGCHTFNQAVWRLVRPRGCVCLTYGIEKLGGLGWSFPAGRASLLHGKAWGYTQALKEASLEMGGPH